MIISDLEHLDVVSRETNLDKLNIMGGLIFLAIEASANAAASGVAITAALTQTTAIKADF